MNLKWNVDTENDPDNGRVGVALTAAGDSVLIRELLPPVAARQLGAALIRGAELVAPTPPPLGAPPSMPTSESTERAEKG
jgi:hypothetical protein